MKRSLFALLLSAKFLLAQTILDEYLKIFSFEQRLQHKQIEQMYFDSIYDWRAWGIFNLGVRNNFIGGTNQVMDLLPQVGFDRSYLLSHSELLVGMEVNASGGKANLSQRETSFLGYGVGGNILWKMQSGYSLAFSTKITQIIQKANARQYFDSMWLFDINFGKRWVFQDGSLFVDANFHFGTGAIADFHRSFVRGGVAYDINSEVNIPFNLMTHFSLSKTIGKNLVKASIAPVFESYARGKIYKTIDQNLLIEEPKPHFDILVSIAYDIAILDSAHFVTYADFNLAQFEIMTGVGFRLEFGQNKFTPLKYPKIKLKKLKNTYLK